MKRKTLVTFTADLIDKEPEIAIKLIDVWINTVKSAPRFDEERLADLVNMKRELVRLTAPAT